VLLLAAFRYGNVVAKEIKIKQLEKRKNSVGTKLTLWETESQLRVKHFKDHVTFLE